MLVATALTVPVVAMAMVPALQFEYWQWLSLTLAAPVVVWAGAPFHRAAWTNARHGAATMDTLVSLGTIAAFATLPAERQDWYCAQDVVAPHLRAADEAVTRAA